MFGLPSTSTKQSKQTPIIQNAVRKAPVSVIREASPKLESIAAANVVPLGTVTISPKSVKFTSLVLFINVLNLESVFIECL